MVINFDPKCDRFSVGMRINPRINSVDLILGDRRGDRVTLMTMVLRYNSLLVKL